MNTVKKRRIDKPVSIVSKYRKFVSIIVLFYFFQTVITKQWLLPAPEMIREKDHKGDCGATGPRRPPWDDRSAFRKALPEFKTVYKNRPFKSNIGGMHFDHSFALWYILKAIKPTPSVVVESGAHRGHSTWLI